MTKATKKSPRMSREQSAALEAILYPAAPTVGVRGSLVTPEFVRRITETESRAGSVGPEEKGHVATKLSFDEQGQGGEKEVKEVTPHVWLGERDGWMNERSARAFMSSDIAPSR